MKITFALNDEKFESYIKNKIQSRDNSVEFTEPAYYSDLARTIVEKEMPDILLLNEALPSTNEKNSDSGKGITFGNLIKWVRKKTDTRIIMICTKHESTDGFYKALINLGIYDILSGDTIKISEIVDCIFNPKTYKDISYLVDDNDKEKISPAGNPVVTDVIENTYNNANQDKKITKHNTQTQKSYSNNSDLESPGNNESDESDYSGEYSGETTILTSQEPEINNFIFDFATNSELAFLRVNNATSHTTTNVDEVRPSDGKYSSNLASEKSNNVVPYKKKEVQSVNPAITPDRFRNYAQNQLNDSYYGYKDSNVLIGPDNPYKRGKIALFLNVKTGSGCESIASQEAFALASVNTDKKTLLIDCNIGTSIIYDRLCLPHEGYRLDSMDKNPEVCLTKSKLMFSADAVNAKRFKLIPDNLAFLRMSSDFMQNGNMSKIKENILSLASCFDYIIISAKGEYDTDFITELLDLSDSNYYVVMQDYYELNVLLDKFKSQKDKIIINKFVSNCDIDTEYIARMFSLTDDRLFTVSYDSGFVKYAAKGYAYYPFAKFKTKKQSDVLASDITKIR